MAVLHEFDPNCDFIATNEERWFRFRRMGVCLSLACILKVVRLKVVLLSQIPFAAKGGRGPVLLLESEGHFVGYSKNNENQNQIT